ncbi:MAG TPA: ornithine cyclodeaminase [Thermomicrobiaceae bacterium]|nr:ornithine cyclodeaminase [Thermomicrobiaceae bacterium]
MLALTRDDVQALVPMRRAIELMKLAFADLSAGRAVAPLRTAIDVPASEGVTLFMPAYVPSTSGLGVKIVSVFPHNRDLGKPTIHALVVLTSTETGEPLAVLDGTFLTALRTGAVSGAATDLLARPDSRVLTVFGAGAQGLTQAWAVAAVRPIERIYVCDVSLEAAASFGDRLRSYAPELADRVVPAADPSRAVAASDVICTATTSRVAVFDDRDVRPGTHINAIGAFTPEMQEIPDETVGRAVLVVDAVEAVLAEAGDLLIAIDRGRLARAAVRTELGQVVAGSAPGRTSPDEVTLFKSVGNAVQDVVVAREAVSAAELAGRGLRVEL